MSLLLKPFAKCNVPIGWLHHDDREIYVREGFGGRPIVKWPVFTFYSEYLEGRSDEARDHYGRWYEQQFLRYATVSKKLGGMEGGSLHALVKARHQEANEVIDFDRGRFSRSILERAIADRVDQRLALLESIRSRGYCLQQPGDAIAATRRGRHLVLRGGHHRVAALAALGYRSVPLLKVYPFRSMVRAARRIERLGSSGRVERRDASA